MSATIRTPEAEVPLRQAESPSLIRLLTLIVRRWRLLVGLPLVAAAAALGVSFLLPGRFTVETRFTPEQATSGMSSQLMGLASQFGLDVGSMGENSETLDFYGELLESSELLRTAVLAEYSFTPRGATEPLQGNLVELLEVKGDTEAERTYAAVEELDDLVVVRIDHNAAIVGVEVSAPWPELSVLLAERLLQLVNEFNLERRQTRAAAERRFLEGRVDEVGRQLGEAEAELEAFLMQNRRFEDPRLRLEQDRLERQVDLRQQLFVGLSQNLEQARLAEVRNTAVITVLDPPRPPAERTAPNYILNVALGLLLGFLIALGAVLGSDIIRQARASHPDDFAQLDAALRRAFGRGRLRGGPR